MGFKGQFTLQNFRATHGRLGSESVFRVNASHDFSCSRSRLLLVISRCRRWANTGSEGVHALPKSVEPNYNLATSDCRHIDPQGVFMTRYLAFVSAFFLLMGLLSAPALAEKRVALVVGNDR